MRHGNAGFKPYKVTHSSDSFQQLYDLAVELIKRWVCPLLEVWSVARVLLCVCACTYVHVCVAGARHTCVIRHMTK